MKRPKFTLGVRIGACTFTLSALLFVTAWGGLRYSSAMNDSIANTASVTVRKVELAGRINDAQSDMAAGERGSLVFAYAKDPAQEAGSERLFEQGAAVLQASLAEIRPLLITDAGRRVVGQMEELLSVWLKAHADLKRLAEAGDADGAARTLAEKTMPPYRDLGTCANELQRLAHEVLVGDQREAESDVSALRWFLIPLLCAGALATAVSFVVVRSATGHLREVATEMLDGSRKVAAVSGQVASASQSLAQGSSEQAATLEETSSSATEITAVTRKNADNTRSVAGLMAETARLVENANHNLKEMVESMKEINGSSEKISKIIRVIDEIAFQTNILALNAAVEAARAGEAGMGFAVVADEVRSLAQRSAQAAKDTAQLIEESIAKSGAGSTKLAQVGESISRITASATQVKTLVDEVDVGSQEQSRGIEQIATAVSQMEQVTQRSAADAEKSAAASEELASQAQGLYGIVEKLRELVGGKSDQPVETQRLARHSPNASSSLAALGNTLRSHENLPAAPFAVRRETASVFPLDENEAGF
ncbi:MAG: methyl-accepting chemotaxis protein [Candidatus Sulfopaludibacter sp.]|nr:methyl-accepting chemotaxis protein [Candidatus Sulfopaludibacter sp.]